MSMAESKPNEYGVVRGNESDVERFRRVLKGRVAFVLVAGNTRTAEIAGITVAGANPELVRYTPPADAELVMLGKCLSIKGVPATPDGKPTPALISRTALRLIPIPKFVCDAGMSVKPKIPHFSLNGEVGGNIKVEDALRMEVVEGMVENGKLIGKEISKLVDCVIIGETIPAGTTTAAAVMKAMGCNPKVSSSMPENPVKLKMSVVEEAVKRVESDNPMEVLSKVGDPVLAAILGISLGAVNGGKYVLLAGGTQMVAASLLISKFRNDERIAIATTSYVASDPNADFSISPFPVFFADPMLGKSEYPGLAAYGEGFVKEGVGAGGLTFLAYSRGVEPEMFLKEVEKDYENIVLKPGGKDK